MNKRLAILGIVITVLYLGVGAVFVWGRLDELQKLPLNELGDFMAGAFGPLAIFWLVLGFFQQGEELRLNTDALHLQAEELRQSVNQQREMVRLNTEEQAARREAAKPVFTVAPDAGVFQVGHGRTSTIRLTMANVGQTATDVYLSCEPRQIEPVPAYIQVFGGHGNSGSVSLLVSENETQNRVKLFLKYVDATGAPGVAAFQYELAWSDSVVKVTARPLGTLRPVAPLRRTLLDP